MSRRYRNRNPRVTFEKLELRALLSGSPALDCKPVPTVPSAAPLFMLEPSASLKASSVSHPGITNPNAPSSAKTPAQMLHAYGFDQIQIGGTPITFTGASPTAGAGETIAIVDAYHDPNILSDLQAFDANYGLANPVFQQVTLGSGTQDSSGGWELEESLDVEWAHAIAPAAKIMLVEANSSNDSDLLAGVDTAVSDGANVVSMSWGGGEFSGETAASIENHFIHTGVTFVASSGDSGAPADWPSVSPNVVAVGGTSLTLNSDNTWKSESAWSGSTGGISVYEAKPGFQPSTYSNGSSTGLALSKRGVPDVAYNADPNTGVAIYDSVPYSSQSGWFQIGGTSAGAPQWAALISIADQVRGTPLSSASTLAAIYANSSNYHDVTSGTTTGNPNFTAGVGYDLTTGLGTPMASQVVSSLSGGSTSSGANHFSITGVLAGSTAGGSFSVTVTALNAQNSAAPYTGTVHFSSSDANALLPANYTFTAADNGTHTFSGVVLKTAGPRTIIATDTVTSSITGSATVTVSAASASILAISGYPTTDTPGTAAGFTVTAKDAYGNTASGYTGTVHFTSSDAQATLPANYTFLAADAGVKTFSATLNSAGTQSITATDTTTTTITGAETGIVVSGSAWGSADIGAVGTLTGGYSVNNGVYTVSGAGADIWGTADAFHFVYMPLSGDGQIIARVTAVQNTNGWAKAGVMIRETLAAGSRQALVAVTPSDGVAFQDRATTNQASVNTNVTGFTAPYWIKLVRSNNTFTAYRSANGTTWTQVGAAQTITMASNVYVGLAVTAHNSGALNTSTFDNVSVTPYTNLALNKTATASSTSAGSAANAVDGNTSTTWTSSGVGAQTLTIDLGATHSLSHIRVNWGTTYAKSYGVQISTDGNTWTTVFSTTTGTGGILDLSNLVSTARYVRLNLTAGTLGSYAVSELSAFGM